MIVIVDLLLRGILLPRTLTGREPPGLCASEGIPDLDLRLHRELVLLQLTWLRGLLAGLLDVRL